VDFLPDGPRSVTSKNQVTLPAEMLEHIGVSAGDSVWIMPNPDKPQTLVVLARSGMQAMVEKGWTAV
jgi:bifunctional DNA-binding transcriptional regulator/antitoxin component of YhaV-PrlF toxin-antitoxin module